MKQSAKFTSIFFTAVFSLFNSAPSQAEESTWEDYFLLYNRYLSEKIDWAAEKLDLFLSRKKYTDDPNKSSIVLKSFGSHFEGGKQNSSFNFDINLRLPNLEERWAVRFTSYDPNQEERGVRNQQQRTVGREINYGAGLFLLQELGNIKTTFQPRIQLQDPLQTSYMLRFQSSADAKLYRIDPRLELFADSRRGTGQFLSLNMQLSPDPLWSVVFFNEEQYESFNHLFSTVHGFYVNRSLQERSGIGGAMSFRSLSQPGAFHLADMTLSATFSSEPYRQVFAYSVGPLWRFTKDENFKGALGLSCELQLIF